MNEMLERVAATIEDHSLWNDEIGVTNALEVARAAIEAMREPTEAMKAAGKNGICGIIHDVGGTPDRHFERLWQVGIDAALQEKGGA